MKRYLVLTDIDSIQSYLFSSTRLAMIAGASRIVMEFDDYVRNFGERDGVEVLTYSGGSSIVRFDDKTTADEFCREAEARFRSKSVSGHLTTAGPTEHEDPQFKAAMERAHGELQIKKRLGFSQGESLAHAMARRCTTCGLETASEFEPRINLDVGNAVSEAGNWYGPACIAKWKAKSRRRHDNKPDRAHDWIDWLREMPEWAGLDPEAHLADKFSDFVSEHERLALIVADVNGVGERLLTLDEAELKTFSAGLARSIRDALVRAIRATCEPYRSDVLTSKTKQRLPLLVLYHGGDDLVIASRAELAMPFVRVLTTEFRRQNELPDEDGDFWNDRRPLGLSASVVISGPGFPFRTSHRIASRLLSEAKKAAREQVRVAGGAQSPWQHGAIDFAIVSESYANADSIIADRGKIGTRGMQVHQFDFTGRPYCVGDGTRRDFTEFLAAARVLREFPNSRLHELREICSLEFLSKALKDQDVKGADMTADVSRVFEYWKTRYSDWLRRTNRNPALQQLWVNAMQGLEVKAGSGLLESTDHAHSTAVGDFAELVGLLKPEHDRALF